MLLPTPLLVERNEHDLYNLLRDLLFWIPTGPICLAWPVSFLGPELTHAHPLS